jgi:hypothetical protein
VFLSWKSYFEKLFSQFYEYYNPSPRFCQEILSRNSVKKILSMHVSRICAFVFQEPQPKKADRIRKFSKNFEKALAKDAGSVV